MHKQIDNQRQSFNTQLGQWIIEISLRGCRRKSINFLVTSQKNRQIKYVASFDQRNLPIQIQKTPLKNPSQLYFFLEAENLKGMHIFVFNSTQKTLKFACRQYKTAINIKMKRFESKSQIVQFQMYQCQDQDAQQSNQLKKQISQPLTKIKYTQQKELYEQQSNQHVKQSTTDYMNDRTRLIESVINIKMPSCVSQILQESKIQIDWEQSQEEQQKVPKYFVQQSHQQSYPLLQTYVPQVFYGNQKNQNICKSEIKFHENQQLQLKKQPYSLNLKQSSDHHEAKSQHSRQQINAKDLCKKQIKNQIALSQKQINNQFSLQGPSYQMKGIDFKPLIIQNIQLKQQNRILNLRVINVEQQNLQLKKKVSFYEDKIKLLTQAGQSGHTNPFMMLSSLSNQINQPPSYHNPYITTNIITPMNPIMMFSDNFSNQINAQNYVSSPQGFIDQPQNYMVQHFKDQFVQQSLQNLKMQSKTKIAPQKSPFWKYYKPQTKTFSVLHKRIKLEQFQSHFHPYDWSCVQTLQLDGNILYSEGINKILSNYWPNLTNISACYNQISDIMMIQNLPKLKQIDVRFNPLSQNTRLYLQKLTELKQISILY